MFLVLELNLRSTNLLVLVASKRKTVTASIIYETTFPQLNLQFQISVLNNSDITTILCIKNFCFFLLVFACFLNLRRGFICLLWSLIYCQKCVRIVVIWLKRNGNRLVVLVFVCSGRLNCILFSCLSFNVKLELTIGFSFKVISDFRPDHNLITYPTFCLKFLFDASQVFRLARFLLLFKWLANLVIDTGIFFDTSWFEYYLLLFTSVWSLFYLMFSAAYLYHIWLSWILNVLSRNFDERIRLLMLFFIWPTAHHPMYFLFWIAWRGNVVRKDRTGNWLWWPLNQLFVDPIRGKLLDRWVFVWAFTSCALRDDSIL